MLENLSGVPAPTTYRFLKGEHKEPRSSIVRQWARVYGVTEAQLRGYEPIQGALIPTTTDSNSVQVKDFPHLTREEKTTLNILRRIRKESKKLWLRLGVELSGPPEDAEGAAEIKSLLAKTGYVQRRQDRRQLPDRRMGDGSSYAPAKQRSLSEKNRRA